MCRLLLPPLVRRKLAAYHVLQCSAWRSLYDAVASGEVSVSSKTFRRLYQCLMEVTIGLPDGRDAAAYVDGLLRHTVQELRSMSGVDTPLDGPHLSLQQASANQRAAYLLEGLRGACRGTAGVPPEAREAAFVAISSAAPALPVLFEACRQDPSVVELVLKLVGDVVEHHLAYLQVRGVVASMRRACLFLLTAGGSTAIYSACSSYRRTAPRQFAGGRWT